MACHRPSTDVGLGLVMRETWVYVAPQFLTVILAAAYGQSPTRLFQSLSVFCVERHSKTFICNCMTLPDLVVATQFI